MTRFNYRPVLQTVHLSRCDSHTVRPANYQYAIPITRYQLRQSHCAPS